MSTVEHDLSPAQLGILAGVAAAGRQGYNAAERDPTMQALARRDLIEWRGPRSAPRMPRWHATAAGRDVLAADKRRRGLIR